MKELPLATPLGDDLWRYWWLEEGRRREGEWRKEEEKRNGGEGEREERHLEEGKGRGGRTGGGRRGDGRRRKRKAYNGGEE